MTTPVIVVHGGCGTVAADRRDGAVAGVRAAVQRARAELDQGGDCQRAAVAAIRMLEDDPVFNAGRGACMTAAGTFEFDAALMRSRDLRSGAVAAVADVRDPIVLAELVLEHTAHCLIAGPAAAALGRDHGVGHFGRNEVWTRKSQDHFEAASAGQMPADGHADTVGVVVLDGHGDLCAAGSTGGVLLKRPGRVGDTPVIGGGVYAHPRLGAVCATGQGEAILTHVMAYRVLERIASGAAPQAAAEALCQEVAQAERATCGLIVVTPDGRTALAHASRHMSWARARGVSAVEAGLGWRE